ncbi:unnamed protein product [Cyclocybe aegerita]|uniref:Uncharacterized protein n=1 Tax=Cyclocybe aegerita TaxID=1973307 RepID=A0A8S0WXN9_CYCAE|nr:unnamed protein product [Cyclocybe aegerita]
MAEVGGAAISAVANLAASTFTHLVRLSSRHDHSYNKQAAETDRLSRSLEDLHRKGEVDEEQYDQYRKIKQTDVSPRRLSTKFQTKTLVRKAKGKMREANHTLREHYQGSASGGSEVPSIAADSGSPPGSALESERIRDWATDVEQNENAADERSQHQDPCPSEHIESPSTTSLIDTSFLSSSAPALFMHDPDTTEEDQKVYAHRNSGSISRRQGARRADEITNLEKKNSYLKRQARRGTILEIARLIFPASPSEPQLHIQQQAPTTRNAAASHEPNPNPNLSAVQAFNNPTPKSTPQSKFTVRTKLKFSSRLYNLRPKPTPKGKPATRQRPHRTQCRT